MSRQPERRGQPASPSDEEESAPAHNTRHRVGGARVLHSPPPAGRALQASVADVTHPPLPPLSGGRVQSSAGSVSTTSSRRRALVARAAAAKAQLEKKQLQREAERVRRLAEKEAEIENNIAAAERDELEARLQEELAELSEEEEEKRPRSRTSEARIQQVEEWLAAGRQREEPAVGKDPEHCTHEEDRAVAPLIPRGKTTPGTEVTTIADLTRALVDAVKTTAGAANVAPQAAATDRLLSRLTTRDIAPFSGDPTDWLRFKAAYDTSTHLAQYSAKENIIRLQSCLKGEARDAVAAQMLVAASPETVMKTLELRFGRPDLIVGRLIGELQALPRLTTHQGELIALATKAANTTAAIQATGQRGYLYSPELLKAITSKLSEPLLLRWRDYAYERDPAEPKLPAMAEFLMGEADRACRTGTVEALTHAKVAPPSKPTVKPAATFKKKEWHGGAAVLAVTEETCPHCSMSHALPSCADFKKKEVEERWDLVRKHNLCFRCLSSRHIRTRCEKKLRCETCQRNHHSLLHKEAWTEKASESTETVAHVHEGRGRALLKVVPVRVEGPKGSVETCALLDEGATISLVDSALATKVGAVGPTDTLTIQGATAQQRTSYNSKTVALLLHTTEGPQPVEALRTVQDLHLPSQSVGERDLALPHLRNVPIMKYDGQPQLLIGQDNWHLIVTRELREGAPNQPVASKTRLGWVLHGCHSGSNRKIEYDLHVRENREESVDRLHQLVETQFALDSIGISPARRVSPEDKRALATLDKARRTEDGRWEVGLLWRNNKALPNNRGQAETRLRQLQRKMKRDPFYAAEYKKKIGELFERDYAERVEDGGGRASQRWFLPHFGVRNPNKPGKLRLVFDAAAEYGGVTLNAALLTGPPLINSLLGVLLRFREGKYAVVADIQEMFLRVRVKEEDRRVQSFLWQTEEDAAPAMYQMKSLVFGATCSPTTAIYVLNRNAEESGCSPRALAAVKTRHYVDDYLDSFATKEEAREVVNEVDVVHQRGGFKLRGWRSNEEEILGDRVSAAEDVRLGQPTENAERTLGLLWRPREDTLSIAVDVNKMTEGERPSPTKRKMLAMIMSCFDPLGLVAPTMIRAKILMQRVWRSGIEWDDELEAEDVKLWNSWLDEVKSLQEVRVPRYFNVGSQAELHVFVDASAEAYAAVTYLKGIGENGDTNVAFVAAKCKVAPLKTTTIPRMELQAAVVGARLGDTVMKELDGIDIVRRYYWTDSRTVYSWIRGAGNSEPFVAHRLAAIEEMTTRNEWRWLPGEVNVADAATRAEHDDTAGIRWLRGPDFLRSGEEAWPPALHEEEAECVATVRVEPASSPLLNLERFSRWGRAVGALAYVLLFLERCRGHEGIMRPELLARAERLIIRQEQEERFDDEFKRLSQKNDVRPDSKLIRLSPGIDADGCLRVMGRTSATEGVTQEQRQPYILDKGSRAALLVTEEAHRALKHQQLESQINEVRQRFHILGHRNLARKIAGGCAICRLARGRAPQPRMGDLPAARLAHHERPFTHTGVDLFGPVHVAVGRRQEKRWIALFTCMTTRAIHLEVVHSLTQDATLMALRRMAARRGYPSAIYSDNGTNFVGAREKLLQLTTAISRDPRVQRELAAKGAKWETIPPAAPHMGGAWERLIRAVKAALSTTLKTRAPRDELLITVLAEAEATVNSRPLTHVSIDPGDAEALTPNHFLLGGSNTTPRTAPGGGVQDMKRQWRLTQELADKFWERWVKEYLPELRRRERWPTDQGEEIAEGDVVVIADGNSPRNIWPRGRILRLHRGRDGRARVVDVATRGGVLRRPVRKIVVIHHREQQAGGGEL